MEICKHQIDKTQIVGIGPLMVKSSGNEIGRLMNTRQLNFYLHLKQQSILIESDWQELDPMADREGKNKAALTEFQKEYWKTFDLIKNMIAARENENQAPAIY